MEESQTNTIVAGVLCVSVALGLGLGGVSWGPLIFVVSCFLSTLAGIWQIGGKSALASIPIASVASLLTCPIAIGIPSVQLGESSSRTAMVIAAFLGISCLLVYMLDPEESSDDNKITTN